MINRDNILSWKKRHSIRYNLVGMTLLSLSLILVIQIFWITNFMNLGEKYADNYARDNLDRISGQVNVMLGGIDNSILNLSINSYIQEYIIAENQERKYIILLPFVLQILNTAVNSNNNIYDILILNNDGDIVFSLNWTYSSQIINEIELPDFSGEMGTKVLDPVRYGQKLYIPFVREIYGSSVQSGYMNHIATCVLLIDISNFQSLVENVSIAEEAELFIVDEHDNIIASNITTRIGESFDTAEYGGRDGSKAVMYNGKASIIQQSGAGKWSVWSIISKKSLFVDIRNALFYCIVCSVIVFMLLCMISSIIIWRISGNVRQMMDFLGEVSEGNSKERLKLKQLDEISYIAENVNQMLDRLDESNCAVLKAREELYETNLLNQKMQYAALRSEINPHFLFNTLSCISGIAVVAGIPDIVNIISAMKEIFLYSNRREDAVLLGEEIRCVQNYIDIITIRYTGKISGEVYAEEGIGECRVPKMILQPFVENAVLHGLEKKRGGGVIRIRCICIEEDMILIEISDNGIGIQPEKLLHIREQIAGEKQTEQSKNRTEQNESRHGIGMLNVSERLRLYFKGKAEITVHSEINKGTSIVLRIPAVVQEPDLLEKQRDYRKPYEDTL